ncbi:MAG: c-type cytochrome [Planctomycetaceae bacterium]
MDVRDTYGLRLDAGSPSHRGGKLLSETLNNIRDDTIATLTDAEREHFASQIEQLTKTEEVAAVLPQLALVRKWAWEDLEPRLTDTRHGRSWQQGQAALAKASCLRCHRFGEQGTFTGPDLTNVGRRFDERALLESMLIPSKVIDEKYRVGTYVLKSGKVVNGRPVGVNATSITLQVDPLSSETVIVQRGEIEESSPSSLSPMPEGLLNVLTETEIFDLIAFLKSGGDPEADVYRVETATQN